MIMKRKVSAQSESTPMSAFAARRNKQRLAEAEQSTATASPSSDGPPLKKSKSSAPLTQSKSAANKGNALRREPEARPEAVSSQASSPRTGPSQRTLSPGKDTEYADNISISDGSSQSADSSSDTDVSSGSDSALSQTWEDFLLSKSRLDKEDIVDSTHDSVCIRLKLKSTLVLVGQYDLWVKRGVVSILGAKLHPTPRLHRVCAPSTHSLPVIKCVSGGIEGYAEIEIRSCDNGLSRLGDLSDLYDRIWNGEQTIPKKKLKCDGHSTFSVLYSASDDQYRRVLRPVHLEKKWSIAIKLLSQRGGDLRVLTCGPKGSGKSTFNKYLLNHLLSAPLSEDIHHPGNDGIAFLDLDPGQPEFSTPGHIYLAHMRNPVFGPPFSHLTLNEKTGENIIRSHHIGAISPKDDSDHYAMAIMDLMSHFHELGQEYPQCALVINYPGWIFGQGLEIATWLVNCLGLSDVVYMSEKGPEEVVEPLGIAASQSGVPMTILPSQPTEYVNRSSSQLRSMQMLSYFHSSHDQGSDNPVWSGIPLSRSRSMVVNYSGEKQGILGIMTPGFPREPNLLRDLLDGAVVGVVALENLDAVAEPRESLSSQPHEDSNTDDQAMAIDSPAPDDDDDGDDDDDEPSMDESSPQSPKPPSIIRTAEHLPYLFIGNGTCNPPDPKLSRSLGLAIVRSINPDAQTLDLLTPVPTATIRNALDQGHRIVLVRGHLDNPNWAISEEYFAARAAQDRHRRRGQRRAAVAQSGSGHGKSAGQQQQPGALSGVGETQDDEDGGDMAAKLRERVRRASTVPWMRVSRWDDGDGKAQTRRDKRLWKLRKKADPDERLNS